MLPQRVVIRADAGPAIGMGHVVRCLALARELAERGAEVYLLSKSLAPQLLECAHRLGVGVRMLEAAATDAEATAEELGRLGSVDIVVVDHYGLDIEWERAVRPLASRLMVIEDLARPHACDFFLNQNYHSQTQLLDCEPLLPSTATILLGPTYALLRREFRAMRTPQLKRAGGGPAILVSFGGFEPSPLVELVIEACLSPPLADRMLGGVLHVFGAGDISGSLHEYPFQVHRHHFSAAIATVMAACDLAIGAGGGALWERFCVGIPSLVTILAENQRASVEALAADGYVVALGDAKRLDAAMLSWAVWELWSDGSKLRDMSLRGQKLVDGEGARRVAALLVP